MKQCYICKQEKNETEFYKNRTKKDGLCSQCISCEKEKGKQEYQRDKEKIRARNLRWQKINPEKKKRSGQTWRKTHTQEILKKKRDYAKHLRIMAFNHYGTLCSCCGENRLEFLCIDHINGGGNQHRKEIKNKFYPWLLRNNFPAGFRTLCHNCNLSLGFYGYCPHELEIK